MKKHIYPCLLATALFATLISGCSQSTESTQTVVETIAETTVDQTTTEEPTTEEIQEEIDYVSPVLINGYALDIDLDAPDDTWFDPIQMTTEFSNTFALGTLEGYDVWVDGQQLLPEQTIEITLDTLSHSTGISLQLQNQTTQAQQQYYIRTLTSLYNMTTEGQGDGYYYMGQEGTLYKLNGDGNVVFFKQESTRVYDFMPNVMDDGTVYYSYMEIALYNTNEMLPSTGYGITRAIIMNDHYEIVDEIDFLHTGQGMPETHSLESHEFEMLDLGHYILSGYVGTYVDNIPTDVDDDGEAYVVANVIQEIKDGDLLFQWDSTEHPELYAYSVEKNDYDDDTNTPQDYLHFNSLDIDPKDGNFVASFRNMDAMMKIDRTTGEILWILGGLGDEFGITQEQAFSRQHCGKYYSDNVLTIYDNGNANEQTRVVEFVLDEENKTIVDFQYFQIDGTYTSTQGSAQRLSQEENLFLMGWGSRSGDGVMLSEVNFDTGELIFQVFDFDSEYAQNSYRAFKFDI